MGAKKENKINRNAEASLEIGRWIESAQIWLCLLKIKQEMKSRFYI